MYEFVINQQGLIKIKKALVKRLLLSLGITSVVVILVSTSLSSANDILMYIIGILIISMVYSFYSNIKRQQALFKNYKLIITNDSITREQLNTPSITILKKEITEIVKSRNGSFGIIGLSKLNPIGIPAQLERIDELEILLQEIKPITTNKVAPLAFWIQLGILALGGILLYGTFKIENNIISGLAGLGAVSYLTYSYVIIQRSKNIDRRTKLLSHVIWMPILSLLAAKMLSKELQDLELHQLVKRTVKQTKPITVEYEITEYGKSLETVVSGIVEWGHDHRKRIMKAEHA